jgi:hypothetical protein
MGDDKRGDDRPECGTEVQGEPEERKRGNPVALLRMVDQQGGCGRQIGLCEQRGDEHPHQGDGPIG